MVSTQPQRYVLDSDGVIRPGFIILGANGQPLSFGTVELGPTSLAALESITATGPLTDAQLRATAVSVAPSAGENHIGETGGKLFRAIASFTRATNVTPYNANGVIAATGGSILNPITVSRVINKGGYIVGARFAMDIKSIVPRVRCHLFQSDSGAAPAADNVAYKGLFADEDNRLFPIDFAALGTPPDATSSDYSAQSDPAIRIPFLPKTGTSQIFYVLEALDGFVPKSAGLIKLTLFIDQN